MLIKSLKKPKNNPNEPQIKLNRESRRRRRRKKRGKRRRKRRKRRRIKTRRKKTKKRRRALSSARGAQEPCHSTAQEKKGKKNKNKIYSLKKPNNPSRLGLFPGRALRRPRAGRHSSAKATSCVGHPGPR